MFSCIACRYCKSAVEREINMFLFTVCIAMAYCTWPVWNWLRIILRMCWSSLHNIWLTVLPLWQLLHYSIATVTVYLFYTPHLHTVARIGVQRGSLRFEGPKIEARGQDIEGVVLRIGSNPLATRYVHSLGKRCKLPSAAQLQAFFGM